MTTHLPFILLATVAMGCSFASPLRIRTERFRVHADDPEKARIAAEAFVEIEPAIRERMRALPGNRALIKVTDGAGIPAGADGFNHSGKFIFADEAIEEGPATTYLVGHELVHYHFHRMGLNQAPGWIDEGLATWLPYDILDFDRSYLANNFEPGFDLDLFFENFRASSFDFTSAKYVSLSPGERTEWMCFGYLMIERLGLEKTLELSSVGAPAEEFFKAADLEIMDFIGVPDPTKYIREPGFIFRGQVPQQ